MICLLRVGLEDAEEPDEALLPPVADRLGNYRIERRDDGTPWELGRGAMGVTYRALDTSLRRPVALKLIDSEWVTRGAEARERFMREARAAAALRHPNVATVYHFGIREENGQCFCAMELVEGETLEMRVRRTGPLDALTTIEIALQVSSALAAAEKQGLVHRDLKPGNLMIISPGTDAEEAANAETAEVVVKVIDFGVAKALVESPDSMGLTHGGFVGTPAFASPEQFTSARVDVRSDIYSLGATLCYLLTGPDAFSWREHGRDPCKPCVACLADRTTESRAGARSPDHASRFDACTRARCATRCSRAHVEIARVPRAVSRSLENGAPSGTGCCGHRAGQRRRVPGIPAIAGAGITRKCPGQKHRGPPIRKPKRRPKQPPLRRRYSGPDPDKARECGRPESHLTDFHREVWEQAQRLEERLARTRRRHGSAGNRAKGWRASARER